MKRVAAFFGALALTLGLAAPAAHAEDKPTVIRIAVPGAGTGGRPLTTGLQGTLHLKGVFEEEFKKDGIQVKWVFFPSAGPGVNEAFANGLIDFSSHGDLPLIVGRSTGLKHKIIATSGRGGNVYFVVPPDSPAKTLADLKGKTLATFKGTAGQLQLARVLAKNGFTDKDFRVISADNDTTKASLATKDIDGTLISPFDLEARGIGRTLFKYDNDLSLSTPSTFWVSEAFEKKYPQIVQRVVTAMTRSAAWASDEKHRDEQFQLWAKAGSTPYIDFKKSWEGHPLKFRLNPLIDEYYVASLQKAVNEARQFKLIRRDVSLDGWIEPKYQKAALKELKLEHFWDEYDAKGNIKKSSGQ